MCNRFGPAKKSGEYNIYIVWPFKLLLANIYAFIWRHLTCHLMNASPIMFDLYQLLREISCSLAAKCLAAGYFRLTHFVFCVVCCWALSISWKNNGETLKLWARKWHQWEKKAKKLHGACFEFWFFLSCALPWHCNDSLISSVTYPKHKHKNHGE